MFATCCRRTTTVTLVYTNDLHGELRPVPDWTVAGDPKPMLGGMARLAELVKTVKTKGNCLVLDAGDFMRGSPEANRTRGRMMIDLLSRIGYDAVCVGERDVPWVTEPGLTRFPSGRRSACWATGP